MITATVVYDPTGHASGITIADWQPNEQFSCHLLADADPNFLRVEDELITITADNATLRYRITDTVHDPVAYVVATLIEESTP